MKLILSVLLWWKVSGLNINTENNKHALTWTKNRDAAIRHPDKKLGIRNIFVFLCLVEPCVP